MAVIKVQEHQELLESIDDKMNQNIQFIKDERDLEIARIKEDTQEKIEMIKYKAEQQKHNVKKRPSSKNDEEVKYIKQQIHSL